MKLALRYIPTEVWVDVFCYPWITRRQLGEIVHRFRNRKFVEILQYCLHERGKRTLTRICLARGVIIPRTPMPDNIKFFELIEIRRFDSRTLDFLRRISPLFIFNDVNLDLFYLDGDHLANLPTILDHLAPLLHGIHSLSFNQIAIPIMEQYFVQKMTQAKMLTVDFGFVDGTNAETIQTAINFTLNWLTSEERDPSEPAFLRAYFYWEDFQQFCKAIQQQFLSAKRPCTFAIERIHDYNNDPGVDFDFRLDLQNNLGEQLHGEFDEIGNFQILRHPVDFARTQLQEWVGQTIEKHYMSSVIELCGELTIGPLDVDVNAGANETDEAGEEEADGPSPSKKPKLT